MRVGWKKAGWENVLAALASARQFGSSPDQWEMEALSPNSLVFRVSAPEGSCVIKQTLDTSREVLVGQLLKSMGAPSFDISVFLKIPQLNMQWVVMDDLKLPTLLEHVYESPEKLTPDLLNSLGGAALHADILGIRDRSMKNLLVKVDLAESKVIQIDFGGAFNANLMRRYLQPSRRLSHIFRRLFFDVLHIAGGDRGGDEQIQKYFACFLGGMIREQEKLSDWEVPRHALARPLGVRERVVLAGRFGRWATLERYVNRAVSIAKEKPRREKVWYNIS